MPSVGDGIAEITLPLFHDPAFKWNLGLQCFFLSPKADPAGVLATQGLCARVR